MLTPSSASTAAHRLPENILLQLCSPDAREKLQALREVKNQIIGNRTKKLSFLKLGAVPAVVSALASAAEEGFDLSLIVQSAAAVGSFACGFDTGVKAVLDSSAFPVLEKLISYPDDKKSVFIEFGGLNLLIELSKSMDSEVRVKAVKALRNMMFHADKKLKEEILSDLTIPFIECLIQDAETFVQEQALAMVRNLVDGSISNIDFVFAEDSVMLNAVCKQLQNAEVVEVQIQGMCVLCNVAIGNELHKDAVSHKVAPEASSGNDSITIKSLQSTDNRLRTATIWTIINLTLPSTPGAHRRVERLRNAGIIAQIKTMVNDPCLDVKLRVRTVIEYSATVGEGSVTL